MLFVVYRLATCPRRYPFSILSLHCLTNIIIAVGLSIVNTTYKIYSAQIDGNTKFKAAIFTFTFDQGLFIITSSSYQHHLTRCHIFIYLHISSSYLHHQQHITRYIVTLSSEIKFGSNASPGLVLDQSTLQPSNDTSTTICFPPIDCFKPSNFSLALYGITILCCCYYIAVTHYDFRSNNTIMPI